MNYLIQICNKLSFLSGILSAILLVIAATLGILLLSIILDDDFSFEYMKNLNDNDEDKLIFNWLKRTTLLSAIGGLISIILNIFIPTADTLRAAGQAFYLFIK